MKKFFALLLMLAAVAVLSGCSLLPKELQNEINGILGIPGDEEHTHAFSVTERRGAGCTYDGYEKRECPCGKTDEETLTALGHDMRESVTIPASCTKNGVICYVCRRCGITETEMVLAYGHNFTDSSEPSRFSFCTVEGCNASRFDASTDGKYAEVLTFTFGDEERAVLTAKYNRLLNLLESADRYDKQLHAYAESGELSESYEAVYLLYEEYSELILAAQDQYAIAMTLYYCDNENKELEAVYDGMMDYYTELVAKFYSLSQPWYDSMYREYFFFGQSDEEINSFLLESNAYSNPDYTALENRNGEIELEFYNIENPTDSPLVPKLYAELVENNNKIAEIFGYENYLRYAYECVYERDYSYEDVRVFAEYVKEYIVPSLNTMYKKYLGIPYTEEDLDQYISLCWRSFFEDSFGNALLNDYIDEMNMAFTSNPNKQISFSDRLNGLVVDGNLFRGTYEGAYVTYLNKAGVPIAYFGDGYDTPFTVAHEFGHYMNEIYNRSEYIQSLDLLETHSQGQEMLLLYFAESKVDGVPYSLIEFEQLVNMLYTIVLTLQVDLFEQAIYLDSYDGPAADVIMKDGRITADEYDALFIDIGEELGITDKLLSGDYWRGGMTIISPCYYVSYSVSAINAIQIYMIARTESPDAAREAYLKLFTYTDTLEDTSSYMTTEEVLLYADMLSYRDEELYKALYEFFAEK